MKNLQDNVDGIIEILVKSKQKIFSETDSSKEENTGFVPYNPYLLSSSVLAIYQYARKSSRSLLTLDLGCGNGGFSLMMASLGFDSYGIDLNPSLINHASENLEQARSSNLIPTNTKIKFVQGNIYPLQYLESYRIYAHLNRTSPETIPTLESTLDLDPYSELKTNLSQADVIYSWLYLDQMKFFTEVMMKETKTGTIFALPNMTYYDAYRNPLNLVKNPQISGETFFIGVKTA